MQDIDNWYNMSHELKRGIGSNTTHIHAYTTYAKKINQKDNSLYGQFFLSLKKL